MTHFVGLDVSKATTSICILDARGDLVQAGLVETDPKAIIGFLRGDRRRYKRIGIEAGLTTPWIYEALAKAGLPVICIECRHAHGMLKSRINKTDRNDARGIAEIMHGGLYKAVHIKTQESQNARLFLSTRRFLKVRQKDVDNVIRMTLLQAGKKLQAGRLRTFESRARTLAAGSGIVGELVRGLLHTRAVLVKEIAAIENRIIELANDDPICRRLMTAPGVAHLTALTYRTAIDVPTRFAKSRTVAVHLGLTPRTRSSGTIERRGRISKFGDGAVRTALYMAARVLMLPRTRDSGLKAWGTTVAASRGYAKGIIAVARKLAVILHRMWITDTDFESAASPQ
jgi:transposase